MLLCYSGTGNSYSACKTIQSALGGDIVDIARRVGNKDFTVNLEFNEPLGFVFPVYCGNLPAAVRTFIENIETDNDGQHYVYAVFTCSSGCTFAPEDLTAALEKSGLMLDAYFTLLMPNNALMHIEPEDTYTIEQKLEAAETELDAIVEDIRERRTGAIRPVRGKYDPSENDRWRKEYEKSRTTDNFAVTEFCGGCGFCENFCPEDIIEIQNGKAVWTEPTCSLCMGCLNLCPYTSITYGGNRPLGRYYNDVFYPKSAGIRMNIGTERGKD